MHCHSEAPLLDPDAPVILVGHPNVGKSALFGALTGRYVEVSNFPGTTVEVSQGKVDGVPPLKGVPVIDTPGVQSLHARSDDERVTRNILLSRPPRVVVQVADARNLRRSLLLTLQLAELGHPFLLDLNMSDEAHARGIVLDTPRLAQVLGADIVETVAIRRLGVDDLRARFDVARPMGYHIHYDGAIENAVARIAESDIDELVVTDTIPLREDARACKKIRSLSVAGLLAETILRIFTEDSVSSLFIE